ncbi:MAG: tetratricopeptide repeat protein, partial [Burkholderiales bacterium]
MHGVAAYQDAARAADRALDADPEDAELNVIAGEARTALGEDEAALDYYNLALHYDPTNEAALNGRVRSLARLGRAHEIPNTYLEFLKATPTHRDALYALALDAEERGDFKEAGRLLERLLDRHPDDVDSLNLLG